MSKPEVDPKLAQDIEDDMEELDHSSTKKTRRAKMATEDCPDCADSLIGPGLLDAFTQCPTCGGTGKVAELKEAK